MNIKNRVLLFFVLLKFIIHYFLIAPGYDLHRDEYLHLDQARHLAWGYESVPPFTSWISYIILQLGNSVSLIKFFPVLFGALTTVVVWKTIELLKGSIFALTLGATAITLSVLLRINILYQPNSFDILCWSTFYYTIAQYISHKKNKWLYYASIVFAIGFLNKYNIIFLIAGIFPALLITSYRNWFFNRHVYGAMVLALIIISPNLLWQYNHDFPVIHHMKELSETQLVNVNPSDFFKEQLLFFLGSIYVLIAAFISFFTYEPFKKYRLFFWTYIFTIILFTYLKAKGYYAIGLYPVFLAFGAVYLEHILQRKPLYYIRPVLILITIGLFIPFLLIAFPIHSPSVTAERSPLYKKMGLNRWEDGKEHAMPQDFADMLGWSELAGKVDSAFISVPQKELTIVICDNYGQAGAINFYSKQSIRSVSFNADYINWFNFSKRYENVIAVRTADSDTGFVKERPMFESIIFAGRIEDSLAREKGTSIYILKGAKISINDILKQEIQKRKRE